MAGKVESSKARAAYELYLSLGPQRSVEKVRLTYPDSTPTFDMLKRWCTDWNWVERARAYDAEVAARERAQREAHQAEERERRHKRRLKDIDTLHDLADEATALMAAIKILKDPKDVLKFFEFVHKGERLELGEATDRKELQGPHGTPLQSPLTLDLSGFSEEELDILERLLRSVWAAPAS